MNIKETIGNIIKEEFTGSQLYGYHCTPCKNVSNIEKQGFKVGPRQMQGEGVYAFYNLSDDSSGNAAIGYGQRHIGNEFCIVKFVIKYPQWLLILNKQIAEEVLGPSSDIEYQVSNMYDGWEEFIQKHLFPILQQQYRTPEYAEEYRNYLQQEFQKGENGQKNLLYGKGELEQLSRFGIIYDGEYGIQYLIKRPQMMQPIGYYTVKYDGGLQVSEFIPFTGKMDAVHNKINTDEKFAALREYDIKNIEDLQTFKSRFEEKQRTVRNNREYEYYDNLINLIDQLLTIDNMNENNDNVLSELQSLLESVVHIEDEGVADRYAEKEFNMPDPGVEQDLRAQEALLDKPYAVMTISPRYDAVNKTEEQIPVYKNPKTLSGFGKNVRAILDAEGNLYVAQRDGNFVHGEMGLKIGLVQGSYGSVIYNEPEKYQLMHRVGNTNGFAMGDSGMSNVRSNPQKVVEMLRDAKLKNPQFDFYPEYFEKVKGEPVKTDNSNDYDYEYLGYASEGVADKYAEKQFNIPDLGKQQDYQATKAIQASNTMGDYVGEVTNEDSAYDTYGSYGNRPPQAEARVFANPRSLEGFQPSVRAISDMDGNLFVADRDGDFYHSDLIRMIQSSKYGNARTEYIQWYRLATTNNFAWSGSYMNDNDFTPEVETRYLDAVKKKNFRFKFFAVHHHAGMDESLNEIITDEVLNFTKKAVSNNITDNENFKNWFGQSKVVDRSGQPLKVYHGTQADFDKFESPSGMMYFSKTPKYASAFATNPSIKHEINNSQRSVMPVYLSIQKPLDLLKFKNETMSPYEFAAELDERGVPVDSHKLHDSPFGLSLGDDSRVWQWIRFNSKYLLPLIKASGFDGIFMYEDADTGGNKRIQDIAYVVFSPNQIKSATGNNGNFDPSNPVITQERVITDNEDNTDEGVADRYAEKTFNIADPNTAMSNKAQQAIDSSEDGKLIGSVITYGHKTNIFLNPKSLKNFSSRVRAISDSQSNLFVAQADGEFVHYELGIAIKKAGFDIGSSAYDEPRNITWLRVKNTRTFGMADSMDGYFQKNPEQHEDVIRRTAELQQKHPEFKFVPKIYWEVHAEDIAAESVNKDVDDIIEGIVGKYVNEDTYMDTIKAAEKTGRKTNNTDNLNQNFWKWFGQSKVVNPDGSPKLMYHGTVSDFNKFDKGKFGFHFGTYEQAKDILIDKRGEYTPVPPQEISSGSFSASSNRRTYGKGSSVMPVYLSIQNPLEIQDPGEDEPFLILTSIESHLPQEDVKYLWSLIPNNDEDEKTLEYAREKIIDVLLKNGYDGLKYQNEYEGKFNTSDHEAWIAFKPEQIKSATGNNGEYSSSNPDITQEGIADRYAEKAFNIPDPNVAMDQRAVANMPKDTSMGELVGSFQSYFSGKMEDVKVFQNPRDLRTFDADVKAVSNKNGDLFVAQQDLGFYHSEIVDAINSGEVYQSFVYNAYDEDENITWHRIGKTNDFGWSVSYKSFGERMQNRQFVIEQMNKVKQKNPGFNFIGKYWEYIKQEIYDKKHNINNDSLLNYE